MRDDVQTVLFDLDGTLIDHFQCIFRCYEYAAKKMGKPPVDYATVRATVGGSVRITMSKLMGAENAERGEALFREHFREIMLEDLHILPGVEWLLDELHAQGRRAAVFTNKHGEGARAIMAHLGLDQKLDAVIGTYDTPWRKPEPEFTRHVLESLNADPATTIMVGDSPYDIQAGKAGGIRAYVVATGSHSEAELLESDPPADGVYADMPAFAERFLGLSELADVQ